MTEPDAADLPTAAVTLTDAAVPTPEELAAAHPCPVAEQDLHHDQHRVSGEDGALVWSWECDGLGRPVLEAVRELTWDDLPPRPWEELTVPDPTVLADYLLSLEYEQLVWLLGRQSQVWAQESRCFVMNHEAQLEELRRRPLEVNVVTPTALEAGKVYVLTTDYVDPEVSRLVRELADTAGCKLLLLGPGTRLLDPSAAVTGT